MITNDDDRQELLRLFALRQDALNTADEHTARYLEGWIDGHCLQNAIDDVDLRQLAFEHGYRVTWDTAMTLVA